MCKLNFKCYQNQSVQQCKDDDAVGMAIDFIVVSQSLVPYMQMHAWVGGWFGGFVAVQKY